MQFLAGQITKLVAGYLDWQYHKEENIGNVRWFLETNKEFESVPIEGKEGLQLLPGIHKSDGFFIAKFRKVTNG